MRKIITTTTLVALLAVLIWPMGQARADFVAGETLSLPNHEPGQIIVKYKTDKLDIAKISQTYSNTMLYSFMITKAPDLGQVLLNKAISHQASSLFTDQSLAKVASEVVDYFAPLNTTTVTVAEDRLAETIAKFKADPNVEYAEPNIIYYPLTNDTYYGEQWALNDTEDHDIDWPEALALYQQKSSVDHNIIAAVIDSGVNHGHADLSNNMWTPSSCVNEENRSITGGCPNHGWEYYRGGGPLGDQYPNGLGDNNPEPVDLSTLDRNSSSFENYLRYSSHGTHVAGIIGATSSNNRGVAGVAPDVKIMALKVGETGLSQTAIMRAMYFSAYNGAKVINASFGSDTTYSGGMVNDSFSELLYDTISFLKSRGVLVVAAAGNGDQNQIGINLDEPVRTGSRYLKATYPCAYSTDSWSDNRNWPALDNVLCVAASGESDLKTSYSNYGEYSVQVAAPGGFYTGIYSTIPHQTAVYEDIDVDYDYKNGTSMATPMTTGLAALIWAYQPDLTYSQVKDIIMTTGDSFTDLSKKVSTGRRINAYKALQKVIELYGEEEETCQSAPVIISPSDSQTVSGTVELKWQAVDQAKGYNVQYGTSTDTSKMTTKTTADTQYTLKLNSGTYYWRLQAVCP